MQGQALLPATAMLEMATAACHSLSDNGIVAASSSLPLLINSSIPQPLQLHNSTAAPPLECIISPSTPNASLTIQCNGSVHLRAGIAAAPMTATAQLPGSQGSYTISLAGILGIGRRPTPRPVPGAIAQVVGASAAAQKLPAASGGVAAAFWAHPAVLDSSLHVGAYMGLAGNGSSAGVIRFAIFANQ